ncbi:MAG: PEP-CTERM sorting domain-containing protein [Phycisphaerae bacterium]
MTFQRMRACGLMIAAAWMLSGAPAVAGVWPHNVGAMDHFLIDLQGTAITVTPPNPGGPLPLRTFGESYTPPADVLDGKGYNDQFGWLAGGIFSPPTGGAIWIRVLSQTPGLETYRGGMRPMTPMHTYNPIFGTAGSPLIWQWDGTMTHNWYAVAALGDYSASYEVYVGDAATGSPLPGYTSDTVSLAWQYVPEPATAWLLALGGSVIFRRRRVGDA